MVPQFVVQPLLFVPHFAVNRLLQLFGQFAGDALLGPAENQRLQSARQDAAGFGVGRVGGVQSEDRTAAEHAGIEEVED